MILSRVGRYDPAMARVRYESKETAGRQFWTGRDGGCATWVDANQPSVNRWLITLEGGLSPGSGFRNFLLSWGREGVTLASSGAMERFADAKRIEQW